MLVKLAHFYRKVKKSTFISKHQDADLLDFVLRKNGFITFRTDGLHFNPSTFKKLLESKQQEYSPFISVDGPVGVNKKINLGPIFLAKKFNFAIKIIFIKADRYWQLKSWDQHVLPKLFTTLHVKFSKGFVINEKENWRGELANFKDFFSEQEAIFLKEINQGD